MADLYEVLTDAAAKLRPPRVWPKIVGTAAGVIILIGLVAFFGSILYREAYKNKVYPGVYVGSFSLGSLTKIEVKQFIENVNNRITKEGLVLSVVGPDGAKHDQKLITITEGENAVQLIQLDSNQLAEAAFAIGRSPGWRAHVSPLLLRTGMSKHLVANVTLAPPLPDTIATLVAPYEDAPNNAGVAFPNKKDLTIFTILPEHTGKIIDKSALIKTIQTQLSTLSFEPIVVTPTEFRPTVVSADIEKQVSLLPGIFAKGAIELNFIDPTTKERHDWNIAPEIFVAWLDFRKNDDGTLGIGLNKEMFFDYIDRNIRPITDTLAQNAKFVIEDGKVKEFQGSKNGLGVNAEKTYQDVNATFEARTYLTENMAKTITIGLDITEPDIKTADVNSLGIIDIIGVGVSTFYGSHTNRIKNIAVAVKRLNGTLIKPGEVFSANKFAGPYILENGFLPELVIKGNRIIKEVGGGMCQIGTTLFRMAMNSGMDIIERQNHSLVVNYYSDPVNGNPGTDATLYDPIHDLKFLNDTGNYILLQTAVNYKTQVLTFTLWGKPDGRKGSYSHPLVSKWIAPGSPQEIPDGESIVKPGAIECQAAYRGAVASFKYTRVTPTDETIERVFDSYYRPLPKICIYGEGYSTSTAAGALGEPGE